MSGFRDMGLGWNRTAVREDKADRQIGVRAEACFEGGYIHTIAGIFLYKYMQGDINFRVFQSKDYAEVVRLWRRAAGVEVAEGDDRASIVAYLRRNQRLSRVAVRQGRIVGAVLCGHDGRRGLIYHLAVARACQGQGVGRRLVEAGLTGLRAAGIQRVILLVAKANRPGRAFWRSLGFEEISGALPLGLDLGR